MHAELKDKLEKLNNKLDNEIKRIEALEQSVLEWEEEQQKKLEEKRIVHLARGDISMSELKYIINELSNFEEMDEDTIQHITTTFQYLCKC